MGAAALTKTPVVNIVNIVQKSLQCDEAKESKSVPSEERTGDLVEDRRVLADVDETRGEARVGRKRCGSVNRVTW